MKMRYFIVKSDVGNIFPIIFPDGTLTSCDFEHEVISSGFVEHRMRGFVCYGEYLPLNMKSRGETDAMLIEQFFGIVKDEIYGGVN